MLRSALHSYLPIPPLMRVGLCLMEPLLQVGFLGLWKPQCVKGFHETPDAVQRYKGFTKTQCLKGLCRTSQSPGISRGFMKVKHFKRLCEAPVLQGASQRWSAEGHCKAPVGFTHMYMHFILSSPVTELAQLPKSVCMCVSVSQWFFMLAPYGLPTSCAGWEKFSHGRKKNIHWEEKGPSHTPWTSCIIKSCWSGVGGGPKVSDPHPHWISCITKSCW